MFSHGASEAFHRWIDLLVDAEHAIEPEISRPDLRDRILTQVLMLLVPAGHA